MTKTAEFANTSIECECLGNLFQWESTVFLVPTCNHAAEFCIQQSLAYIPKCQIFWGTEPRITKQPYSQG